MCILLTWLSRFRARGITLLLAVVVSPLLAQDAPVLPLSWERSDGERYLRAFQESYPTVIDRVEYRDGDWSISLTGRRFYWARARLLPPEIRGDYADYSSIRFYDYYRGPPRMPRVSAEQAARLRTLFARRDASSPLRTPRHNDFLDTLYDVRNRQEAEQRMVRMRFLGHPVTIHPFLRTPLHHVEQKILRRIARDAELRAFVAEIDSVSGYVWRPISGTNARSYHAYGMAVDILHATYERAHVYWRWSVERGQEEWWTIPLSERWSPPLSMIDIFESEGFVWGGKWLLFDALHFEYRPEVLLGVKKSSE